MFYNEIFEPTKVLRQPQEPSSKRDWRALCQLANWYDTHLNGEKTIILLSESHTDQDTPANIVRMNTKQYLQIYYPDNAVLQNLVQVLADVVLEEEEFNNKIRLASKHGSGNHDTVSGYTEVYFFFFFLFHQ